MGIAGHGGAGANLDEPAFSGLCTQTLVSAVRERGGAAMVDAVLARAGETRSVADLELDATWSSYRQLRTLAEAAGELLGGADELGRTDGPIATIAVTDGVLDQGSPNVIMEAVAGSPSSPVSRISTGSYVRTGETTWQVTSRIEAGFEPFPELCQLTMRMLAQLPKAFGFEQVRVTQIECQCAGAEACLLELHWEEHDLPNRQVAVLTKRVAALEGRLAGLQETVRGIVADGDLDTALDRVVRSAAAAVGVPRFVLALRDPNLERSVYSCGVDDDTAAEAADLLRRDGPHSFALVAEIRTPQRSYGWLAALQHDSVAFIDQERNLLDSYARLAAAALDLAVALDDSRREASVARALLALAQSLAEVASTGEMADRLARAVPEVIDCDRALVTLADPATGQFKVVATAGYEPQVQDHLSEVRFDGRGGAQELVGVHHGNRAHEDGWLRELMDLTGSVARASVPIVVDDQKVGSVVATVVDRPERLRDHPELTERLKGLAAQAATALRNARLLDQVRAMALHDPLTSLPNRALLEQMVQHGLGRARRGGRQLGLLFVDLDRFKNVNDSLGHDVGDALIREAAGRLQQAVRAGDTVARLGGDEFVVVLPDLSSAEDAAAVASKLVENLRRPFELAGHSLYVSASIGIAVYPEDGQDYGQLMQSADSAMYAAKASGRDTFVRQADPHHAAKRTARLTLESELHRAIDRQQLTVVYQPQVTVDRLRLVGAEALVRWDHPEHGTLLPAEFLPIAAECGLMPAIDRHVRRLAFRQAKIWARSLGPIVVAVNLSRDSLARPHIAAEIEDDLTTYRVDPRQIEIEITEDAVLDDAGGPSIENLVSTGLRIAVDDFGTGASALHRLRRLSLTTLKIDRSVTQEVRSPDDSAMLVATIELGGGLGLRVIAEGVETPLQARLLREHGCDVAQGYLFGHPTTPEHIEQIVYTQESSLKTGRDIPVEPATS